MTLASAPRQSSSRSSAPKRLKHSPPRDCANGLWIWRPRQSGAGLARAEEPHAFVRQNDVARLGARGTLPAMSLGGGYSHFRALCGLARAISPAMNAASWTVARKPAVGVGRAASLTAG